MDSVYKSDFEEYFLMIDSHILYAKWFPKSEEMNDQDFKNEMANELDFVRTFQIKKYLIDVSEFRFAISSELQEWTDQHVNTKLDELGLQKLAYIASKDFIAQVSIELTMNESVKQNYETRFFETFEEAIAWLE